MYIFARDQNSLWRACRHPGSAALEPQMASKCIRQYHHLLCVPLLPMKTKQSHALNPLRSVLFGHPCGPFPAPLVPGAPAARSTRSPPAPVGPAVGPPTGHSATGCDTRQWPRNLLFSPNCDISAYATRRRYCGLVCSRRKCARRFFRRGSFMSRVVAVFLVALTSVDGSK